jgi:hypothetical protein
MQNWNSLSCLAPGGVCNKAPLASGDDERQIPTNARSWRLCCFRLRQLSEGFRAFPRNRQGRLRVEFTRSPSRPATPAPSALLRPPRRLRMAAILQAATSASTRFGFDPNPRLCRLIPWRYFIGTPGHS